MEDLWPRLEKQLALQFPDLLAALRPPATPAQIADFEAITGQTLPADVLTAYLLHDGCRPHLDEVGSPHERVLLGEYFWASVEHMLERWNIDRELSDEVEPYAYTEFTDPESWATDEFRPWNASPPCWLPIGINHSNHRAGMYLDLLPGSKGCVGQLVINDIGMPKRLISKSFASYLRSLTAGLEGRELAYNFDHRHWYPVDAPRTDFVCESLKNR
jgi:cell wall assembly regulator SMI1